ncbi:MAG: transcriptional regulator [Flavobacteriaceae bacterium]|nr:transcriptional regulator [Flavobacteriaceae bacterium]
MKLLKNKYPFDPSAKHHILIGIGLGIWIFSFLYFTEPLDVSEFGEKEKLIYLPIYGLIGGACYCLFIPLQSFLNNLFQHRWTILSELVFLSMFVLIASIFARLYYLNVIMIGESNPYSLGYYISDILFPAILIILPIVIIGRFSFGKYKEKKLEQTKIEIPGEGTYDGLKLFFDDLIFIQSADNYIEVNYFSGKEIKKSLVRNKLSVIANDFPELLRVHRSYVVNPFHFVRWKTEKNKLSLELSGAHFTPVSNTYKEEVKFIINSTTNN